MATTIQISDTTRQLLETLKKSENARSYDDIIQILVKDRAKISMSMFGTIKDLKWKKGDRLKLNEL